MEEIVEVIAGVSGHTYDTVYDLFFTTERVIACIVHYPDDVPSKLNLGELVVGDFFSRHKKRGEEIDRVERRRQAFQGLHPEDLLASHKANFALSYSDLTRVEVKKGLLGQQIRFHFTTPAGERRVSLGLTGEQVPESRRILRRLLGEKVKA